MIPERPDDWDEDDWVFVAETLAFRMFESDVSKGDRERAWRLLRSIAREHGYSPTEFTRRGLIGPEAGVDN